VGKYEARRDECGAARDRNLEGQLGVNGSPSKGGRGPSLTRSEKREGMAAWGDLPADPE